MGCHCLWDKLQTWILLRLSTHKAFLFRLLTMVAIAFRLELLLMTLRGKLSISERTWSWVAVWVLIWVIYSSIVPSRKPLRISTNKTFRSSTKSCQTLTISGSSVMQILAIQRTGSLFSERIWMDLIKETLTISGIQPQILAVIIQGSKLLYLLPK